VLLHVAEEMTLTVEMYTARRDVMNGMHLVDQDEDCKRQEVDDGQHHHVSVLIVGVLKMCGDPFDEVGGVGDVGQFGPVEVVGNGGSVDRSDETRLVVSSNTVSHDHL
jgi:hypothetical protein